MNDECSWCTCISWILNGMVLILNIVKLIIYEEKKTKC